MNCSDLFVLHAVKNTAYQIEAKPLDIRQYCPEPYLRLLQFSNITPNLLIMHWDSCQFLSAVVWAFWAILEPNFSLWLNSEVKIHKIMKLWLIINITIKKFWKRFKNAVKRVDIRKPFQNHLYLFASPINTINNYYSGRAGHCIFYGLVQNSYVTISDIILWNIPLVTRSSLVYTPS